MPPHHPARLNRSKAGSNPCQQLPSGHEFAEEISGPTSGASGIVTGRDDVKTGEDLIEMSEAVYNFQRVFNLRMGSGRREHDAIPYRSAGPVTVEEYESRQERYDGQLKELLGVDPEGKSSAEKVAILREYREDQYDKLCDAVYKRRGWTQDGIPTVETLKRLRIDFPEVVEVVEKAMN